MSNDYLSFCDDVIELSANPPWKVLIVDDDHDIHAVTDLVMHNVHFEGRPIELWHSYNALEAKAFLDQHSDIAVIFLDVVMETEEAGLEVVTYLRNHLNNHLSRIVLRTGQPGLAPEDQVINQYDINDYKEKSDLTDRKLKTTFFSSLRNYRDLVNLDRSKKNLKRTIEAISHLHTTSNLPSFVSSLQKQLNFLLSTDEKSEKINVVNFYAVAANDDLIKIMTAEEGYHRTYKKLDDWEVSSLVKEKIDLAFTEKCSQVDALYYLGFSSTLDGGANILHFEFDRSIQDKDQEYLSLFVENALVIYESLLLHEEAKHSQHSTILLLGEAVERRSQETGAHVQRVGEISAILAKGYKLSNQEIERIRQASPLHDVGKIGIPDIVLNKPGKFDPNEWDVMKAHTTIGRDLLSKSQSKTLTLASIIAHEHHECWDGTGYPRGLKHDGIHIAGRIVAITDVMDALVSKRCYKAAWTYDEAFEFLLNEKHKRFDPKLVDIFMSCKEEILSIYELLKD